MRYITEIRTRYFNRNTRRLIFDSAPEKVARGLALGVFIGLTPTMGFQMALAAFLASMLRQDILITTATVWITNPVTFIPIYTFNYTIGKLFMKQSVPLQINAETFASIKNIFAVGWDFFSALWIGSLIIGILVAASIYFLSVTLLRKYKKNSQLI